MLAPAHLLSAVDPSMHLLLISLMLLQVAAKLSTDQNHPSRGMAALLHVLEVAAAKDGHTFLHWDKLRRGVSP